MKRTLSIVLVLSMILVCFAGCTSTSTSEETQGEQSTTVSENTATATDETASQSAASEDGSRIGLVTKGAGIAFFEAVGDGATTAAGELGVELDVQGPTETTAEKQIEIITNFIARKVDGILVSANDSEALAPILKQAMEAGIKVISYDGDVSVDARQLFVSTSDPENVASQLIDTANEIAEGSGEIAILSAAATAANQNAWIEYMKNDLEEEKNSGLTLVTTVYGDDEMEKSYQEANGLLKSYPNLKVIISPTAVGILAAAKAIQDAGLEGQVYATGLALPSEVAEYIEAGIVPKAFLWSPIDLGYISVYVMNAMLKDEISGVEGNVVTCGTLGDKDVTLDASGNPQIIIGAMSEFNADNIAEWKDVF